MDTEKTGTIPPDQLQQLAATRRGFWINVAILSVCLFMMVLIVIISGPPGVARTVFAIVVYLVIYTVLLVKLYNDWQVEKAWHLCRRGHTGDMRLTGQPRASRADTARTSRIEIEDMEKLRSGSCSTSEE